MKKIIALFLALTMLLSLTACGKQEQSIDLSGKLDKLPTKQEEPEIPDSPAVTVSEKPEKTGSPTNPINKYIKHTIAAFLPPKIITARYNPNVANDIGTGPSGIENGASTHRTAAINATTVIVDVENLFFFFCSLFKQISSFMYLYYSVSELR